MKALDLRANVGKHQKLLLGNNATGKCLQANMQHLFSPIPAIRWVSIFSYKNQKLVMKPLNLRANGGKTPKTTPGQQCHTGKCLHAHIQHFFSPSPANEEKFAWVSIFSYKNQTPVMKPLNLRANRGKTPKTTLGQQFPWQVRSGPHATFLQPIWRKNSLTSPFPSKNETIEFTSQWGQNTKNYSWATMPLASAFSPTYNISSALAQLMRKNSLSQHFFIQKSNTCHEAVEFTS